MLLLFLFFFFFSNQCLLLRTGGAKRLSSRVGEAWWPRSKVHVALSCLEGCCKDGGAEQLPVVTVWKGAAWTFKSLFLRRVVQPWDMLWAVDLSLTGPQNSLE